jgi:hypothetical protein
MDKLLGSCFLQTIPVMTHEAGSSRQDGAPTKIKGFEGLPQAMGFSLANTPKTAFIRTGPSDSLTQSFHDNLFHIPIAHGYRNCQRFCHGGRHPAIQALAL